jgi:hypothetical protein
MTARQVPPLIYIAQDDDSLKHNKTHNGSNPTAKLKRTEQN